LILVAGCGCWLLGTRCLLHVAGCSLIEKGGDLLKFRIYGVVFHSMLDLGHQAVVAPSLEHCGQEYPILD